jgi:hypothetical protein
LNQLIVKEEGNLSEMILYELEANPQDVISVDELARRLGNDEDRIRQELGQMSIENKVVELKIILPAVTLHHDNVVRDYPNHEIVKAAIETKNYCPTSKSILDAVQKSDRSAASASRDRDKEQDKDKSCSKKSQKPPYPETILPGKNNIPVLQKIPPYWAVDKSYYNNAIVPEKFNTHSRSWEVPLPDNPNLLSDDVILFNQQIKEMYINRYEDQKNAPDISLWSHVSLTAALASIIVPPPMVLTGE